MKRSVFALPLFLLFTLILSGCSSNQEFSQEKLLVRDEVKPVQSPSAEEAGSIGPEEAQKLLVEGNQRFIRGSSIINDISAQRRQELAREGQRPFAVIVSCSDSRVVPEEIFDQGLGDLFVIRVAGNVITPVELGSIEYAVEHLKVPLIVVLGHEQCGAVTAAIEGGELPGSIGAIAEKIKPAVAQVDSSLSKDKAVNECAKINVLNALKSISQSPVIKHSQSLKLLGGIYQLDHGKVQWLDEI